MQYDFGKSVRESIRNTGALNSRPQVIVSTLAAIKANYLVGARLLDCFISLEGSNPIDFSSTPALKTVFYPGKLRSILVVWIVPAATRLEKSKASCGG